MKTKTALISACVCAGVLCGCSDRQMAGTMMGTSIGGVFGSSIGGLMGGMRGSDAGTAIGMVVGGVVGNAVTGAAAKQQNRPYDDGAETRRSRKQSKATPAPAVNMDGLTIENIRFIDENRNQRLDAGEDAKILFEIHNRGNETLYNIAPVVTCSDEKHISVSPTAIVGNIRPGKGVTYTASLRVSTRLKDGMATFTLAFQDGARLVTYKSFDIPTQSRK